MDNKVYGIFLWYNGILLGHKRKINLTICDKMDGPRGYYVKRNKSDRERQILWNLKTK